MALFRGPRPAAAGDRLDALLDALAGQPHAAAQESVLRPDLPPIAREVVVQALALHIETTRVVQAARRLPVSRVDFLADYAQRWRQQQHVWKRARDDVRRDVEAAARATAPGTPERRALVTPALDRFMRFTSVGAFRQVAVRGLVVAAATTALIRFAVGVALVLGATVLDSELGVNFATSVALAIGVYVVVDWLLVDRLIEPVLEAHRFRQLIEGCGEAIAVCEGIARNQRGIAAVTDGVVLPETALGAEDGAP